MPTSNCPRISHGEFQITPNKEIRSKTNATQPHLEPSPPHCDDIPSQQANHQSSINQSPTKVCIQILTLHVSHDDIFYLMNIIIKQDRIIKHLPDKEEVHFDSQISNSNMQFNQKQMEQKKTNSWPNFYVCIPTLALTVPLASSNHHSAIKWCRPTNVS